MCFQELLFSSWSYQPLYLDWSDGSQVSLIQNPTILPFQTANRIYRLIGFLVCFWLHKLNLKFAGYFFLPQASCLLHGSSNPLAAVHRAIDAAVQSSGQWELTKNLGEFLFGIFCSFWWYPYLLFVGWVVKSTFTFVVGGETYPELVIEKYMVANHTYLEVFKRCLHLAKMHRVSICLRYCPLFFSATPAFLLDTESPETWSECFCMFLWGYFCGMNESTW